MREVHTLEHDSVWADKVTGLNCSVLYVVVFQRRPRDFKMSRTLVWTSGRFDGNLRTTIFHISQMSPTLCAFLM